MAAGDQIVRITYQQLEEIVGSAEPDRESASYSKQNNAAQQSPRSQGHMRARRPAQEIYRPGQKRHGREIPKKATDEHQHPDREEDWDAECPKMNSTDEDGSRGSKESSGDMFSSDVQKRLDDMNLGSRPDKSSAERNLYPDARMSDFNKRRGKRPEMQRYIPKGRASDRERQSEEKDSKSPVESENVNELVATETVDPGGGTFPRRVRMKSQEGNMRVTVVNESMGPTSMSTSPGGRSPLLQRKDFAYRQNREFNSSEKSWTGGEWWGKGMGGSLPRRGKNSRDIMSSGDSSTWREGGRRFSNREERNAALKTYSKHRRSNSSDARSKKNQEESRDRKGQDSFSSETFPRTKTGGGKSAHHQGSDLAKDINTAGGNNKSSATTARDGDRLYLGVTRQRTGSISSETSCASYNSNGSLYSGSSDWYTEEDEPEHVLNWAEEVEKAHLEEVARLVHHGAQELTSSLNHYPATVGDSPTQEKLALPSDPLVRPHPHHAQQQQDGKLSPAGSTGNKEKVSGARNRNRRRTRTRKSSSQYGSRDSSVHSSIHGDDDCFSERGGTRRRRRRRHNSGRSQSGRLEGRFSGEGGIGEMHGGGGEESRSGLQVTVGHNNRHVEVHRDDRRKGHGPRNEQGGQESVAQESARGDSRQPRHSISQAADGRNNKSRWDRELPPRFRRESGGGGEGDDALDKKSKGRGSRGSNPDHEPDFDRGGHSSHEPPQRGVSDRRLVDPSHDASSNNSRISQRGRGRRNNPNQNQGGFASRRGTGGREESDAGDTNLTSRRRRRRSEDERGEAAPREAEPQSRKQQQQQGLIHLPHHQKSSQHPSAPPSSSSSSRPDPVSAAPSASSSAVPNPHQHHPRPPQLSLDSNQSQMAGSQTGANSRGPVQGHRQLFDPSNPSTPIVMPEPAPHSQPQTPQFSEVERLSPSAGSPCSKTPPPVEVSSLTMSYPPSFYPPHHSMYPAYRPPFPPFPPMGPPFPHQGHPVGSHPMYYHRFPRMGPAPPEMASYFVGDVDGDNSRAQCHVVAQQILRDSSPFESQLGNILSRRPLSEDSQRMLNQIRFELQNRLEQVILLDVEVASRHSVEQTLWKSVYYQIIEAHRKRMAEDPHDSNVREKLNQVLNEGHRFFENLLQRLQATHNFSLEAFVEGVRPESEGISRYVKLALLSAQRVMMFLGDIARYKEQMTDSTNYGKARQWYLKAQKLHPRNGRPYNQLAILAVYTKRKLDAVYFYMRSLAASNPILTARESLMSLFDEVRRKVEVVEKKRLDDRRQRLARHKKRKSLGARLEIWVAQDGTHTHDTTDEKEEDDLSSLSPVELNKRFTLTFLNVHGKLFTKINFESFAESSSLMLQEFSSLLQHSPVAIASTRFLQLFGINMFAIDNTALKDESLEASCRSVLQEHAVQVGLEMFGLLARRTADLLTEQLDGEKTGGGREGGMKKGEFAEDVHEMLPALKVWVDWMMCHAQLWNPQPFNRPPELGPDVDVWGSLARLCDLLNDMDTRAVGLTRERGKDAEPVVLQEDVLLSGFIPMLSAPQEVFYTDASSHKRQSEDCLRVEKLRLFGEYLCGVEPPMLAFDVDTGKYRSVASTPEDETKMESRRNAGEESGNESDDEVIVESGSDNDQNNDDTGMDAQKEKIHRLKAKKAQLSKQREERERNKENMEAIVASHRHAKIELEIHPIFLIPDTNCFIDHFTGLKAILNCRKFTLVVPLVVINELDGLARGAKEEPHHRQQSADPNHSHMVQSQARAAIAFLECEFEGKHPNLRAQTAKGSVLETIAFRSEEADHTGINDDVILSCCLHYCQDKAREFMPRGKDGPVRLYREVVLLTEDRNLRLKAHTCNVPVRDVPTFKRWSKIP